MRSMRLMTGCAAALAALLLVGCGGAPSAQTAEPDGGDWPMYRYDLAGTGRSPLAQVTPANAPDLTRAWTYALDPAEPRPDGRGPNSQATPIVVDGVMYLPAADRVVALDPVTGQEIWRHAVDGGAPSRRGVAYWRGDDERQPRIIFTAARRLVALEAVTGYPIASFGEGGEVDMGVPYNSVPLVFGNIVVVGANTPPGTIGGIGNARAFDALTGEKVWEFDSVAQPGQVGHDTWEGDSWQGRLGANAWPFFFTADAERDLIFLPLASPIPGAYGGDRPGANLYGNAVVAVDAATGAYRWHFQTIHHDLWDADPPAPPALFDIPRDGGRRARPRRDDQVGLPLHPEPGDRRADLRRRGARGGCERRAGRGDLPDAAVPRAAAADGAGHLRPGGSGDGGRHQRGACRGVRRAGREPRGGLQRRPVHAVDLPPRPAPRPGRR